MEGNSISFVVRRTFKRVFKCVGMLVCMAVLCVAYARFVEPWWLHVRHINLSPNPTVRIIHITDIHYDGGRAHFKRVVKVINAENADVVCFTGDLIENAAFAKEALGLLAGINKPVYGVVGNHDRWELKSFEAFRASFRQTGGDMLTNQVVLMSSGRLAFSSLAGLGVPAPPEYRRVLLEHYPEVAGRVRGVKLDLMLAGHTHGGQARIPFLNRSFLPIDLGRYDKGLFLTPCGPLYVNPGIGTYYWKIRFLCRPEITVIGM